MSKEYVILGGEKPKMKVDQGEGIGRIEVSGSAMHARDPMEAEARAELALLKAQEEPTEEKAVKWCSHRDHVGDRVLPLAAFYTSKLYRDGYRPYCKVCCRRADRMRYERDAVAAGRTVKPYRPRSA